MRSNISFIRPLALLAVLAASLFLLTPSQHAGAQTPDQAAAINAPVGSAFTYQGRLADNGNPANGQYDFQFILYDTATGGNQQGETRPLNGVTVSNGLFSVQLDFGQAVFNGDARFLEVGVKPAGADGPYTVLIPRQALTAVPYALGLPGVAVQNGNVGIGTVAPVARLDIKGSSPLSPGLSVETTNPGDVNTALRIQGPAGTERAIGFYTNNTLEWWFGRDNNGDAASGIGFWRDGTGHALMIRDNGNVGIGTVAPAAKLDIEGSAPSNPGINVQTTDPSDVNTALRIQGPAGTERAIGFYTDDKLEWWFGRDNNGEVGSGIGFWRDEAGGFPFFIRDTGEIVVNSKTSRVPDYVFEESYDLMPLDELAAYVAREKHLPNVPGQDEIHQNGLNLSQFHMQLLEKVEELTLYTLAQQEQIDAQQQQITTLQANMAALEARLAALEQGK